MARPSDRRVGRGGDGRNAQRRLRAKHQHEAKRSVTPPGLTVSRVVDCELGAHGWPARGTATAALDLAIRVSENAKTSRGVKGVYANCGGVSSSCKPFNFWWVGDTGGWRSGGNGWNDLTDWSILGCTVPFLLPHTRQSSTPSPITSACSPSLAVPPGHHRVIQTPQLTSRARTRVLLALQIPGRGNEGTPC